MFELCSLLCLKLYSLNFAIAQKKDCYAYQNSSYCVALLHKKTVLSLETSLDINFEFIKFVKQNGKRSPMTITNRQYYINITFPD